jgi:hypothetical protein
VSITGGATEKNVESTSRFWISVNSLHWKEKNIHWNIWVDIWKHKNWEWLCYEWLEALTSVICNEILWGDQPCRYPTFQTLYLFLFTSWWDISYRRNTI